MLRPGAQVAPVCGKIPVIRSCRRRCESFVFLKLVHATNATHYALSRIFEMRNPGNELSAVLAVLKNLERLVLQE